MIKVAYENAILGNGERLFEDDKLDTIPNVIAKALAEKVVVDGVGRKHGMWIVSKVEEQ